LAEPPHTISPNEFHVSYYGRTLRLLLPEGRLAVGQVLFTKVGGELFKVIGGKSVDGFWEHVRTVWVDHTHLEFIDDIRKKEAAAE
jgi:hypothetical protein